MTTAIASGLFDGFCQELYLTNLLSSICWNHGPIWLAQSIRHSTHNGPWHCSMDSYDEVKYPSYREVANLQVMENAGNYGWSSGTTVYACATLHTAFQSALAEPQGCANAVNQVLKRVVVPGTPP
eukprot:1441926-Amphidinium_carterae.2